MRESCFFWGFLFESTTCLSHHSRSLTSTSMQKRSLRNEHVSCSAVSMSICCSYIISFYLPSVGAGLRPCSAPPPPGDPPEFLSCSRSCAPPATRVLLRRLRPSGCPAGAPPEDKYLDERCDWGVASLTGAGSGGGGVQKKAALKQKCSPGPSGRSGACERAWRKRARGLGGRRRRDGWGEGWMRGGEGWSGFC